jgi:Kef-type K+ transport system membrane component KefB
VNGYSFQPVLMVTAPGPGLLFGLMLVAAIIGGTLAKLMRIPRIVGYLFAGIALHLILTSLLGAHEGTNVGDQLKENAFTLRAIKNLALGLILFSIGGVFERQHINRVGARILRISAAETGLVFVLVAAATATAAWLEFAHWPTAIAMSLLLAAAALETAPAATLFVLREYDAKGPVTDTILSLTGANNILCIVLFYVAFYSLAAVGWIDPTRDGGPGILVRLSALIFGSLLLGVILGVLLSIIHSKLPAPDAMLIFFAAFLVVGAGEEWLTNHPQVGFSYSFLLTALVIGAVFANVSVDPERLNTTLKIVGGPIFAGFFVLAGYQMHIDEFHTIGWIGAAYLVARAIGKLLGVYIGIRRSVEGGEIKPYLGNAMLCQATVAIGLADFVAVSLDSEIGHRFAAVVLGSVVLFELAGPLLTKWTAVRAGEVKAVTLLRRANVDSNRSVLSSTLQALANSIGPGRTASTKPQEELQVRHVMRRNVKFIRASDTLEEVLHFVERSQFDTFPVVDQDGLVGMIPFADLRDIIYEPALAELVTAIDLIDPSIPPVGSDESLKTVLELFATHTEVGSLAVVESKNRSHVIGVVEQRDVLRAMHREKSRTS